MATEAWELAVAINGKWEVCASYPSREEAICDSTRLHEESGREWSLFALKDPDSGKYVMAFDVHTQGSRTVCAAEIA